MSSPADGKEIRLEEMKDETFASGVLGKGAAVIPVNGRVSAPVSGKIISVFPTKHAVSMVDENGACLLYTSPLICSGCRNIQPSKTSNRDRPSRRS